MEKAKKIILRTVNIILFVCAFFFFLLLSPSPWGCAFLGLAILLLPITSFQSLFRKNRTTRIVQILLFAAVILGFVAGYVWMDARYEPGMEYVSDYMFWGDPWLF